MNSSNDFGLGPKKAKVARPQFPEAMPAEEFRSTVDHTTERTVRFRPSPNFAFRVDANGELEVSILGVEMPSIDPLFSMEALDKLRAQGLHDVIGKMEDAAYRELDKGVILRAFIKQMVE